MNVEELKVIKQAILNEIEGYEFYKMAANQFNAGEGREAFLELAEEELKHSQYLRELFENIKDGKEDDLNLSLFTDVPPPRIYKWDGLVGKNSLAVSIFGIGIDMEKASIEFYKRAKKDTKSQSASRLYDILIKWEETHLDQFTEQYNYHREVWWAQQGYAPF